MLAISEPILLALSDISCIATLASLAAACVSMLTLESTMLTAFGDGTMDLTARRILLGATGGVISAFIIVMAVYMILQSNKKIKQLKTREETSNG